MNSLVESLRLDSKIFTQIFPLFDLSGRSVNVKLHRANPGESLPIGKYVQNPEKYGPKPPSGILIDYGDLFTSLQGQFPATEGDFDSQVQAGILELAKHNDQARVVSNQLSELALMVINNPELYSDRAFRQKYRVLVQSGYYLLNQYQESSGFDTRGLRPVVMLRAGLAATEATLPDHSRHSLTIDIKRAHLINENPGDLAIILSALTQEQLSLIDSQHLLVCDPAYATGSSLLGLILAAASYGVKPMSIQLRSLAANELGLTLSQKLFQEMGIDFKAYVLALNRNLNEHYYLSRATLDDTDAVLGDAGDGLYGPKI